VSLREGAFLCDSLRAITSSIAATGARVSVKRERPVAASGRTGPLLITTAAEWAHTPLSQASRETTAGRLYSFVVTPLRGLVHLSPLYDPRSATPFSLWPVAGVGAQPVAAFHQCQLEAGFVV
jgi:beta-lactamase class A